MIIIKTGNRIGPKRAGKISEALKVNTTLITLNLSGEISRFDDKEVSSLLICILS